MTIPETLYGISYDAQDAAVSAEFWAAVLGRMVNPGASSESASIAPGMTRRVGRR